MIRARKRFGQHFLEPAWVDKVVRAIDPKPDETFMEIGPGGGALTRPLAARVKRVVAYEIDRDLAAGLRAAAIPNLAVVEGDFLELGVRDLESDQPEPGTGTPNPEPTNANPIRVAGNLPYNVASPILFTLAGLFAAGVPIADATVMLQREVADRLAASPGTRQYGVLSVLMQHVAHVSLLLKLPAGAFRPAPNVLSSLVRLRFHAPDPAVADPQAFAALVEAVFTRRRKTLSNALRAHAGETTAVRALAAAGVDGSRRPETVSVAEFARLSNAVLVQGSGAGVGSRGRD
jgi:16S rRNA (adenine1518-N6/adenine1519-N6)-dimethyltransferase